MPLRLGTCATESCLAPPPHRRHVPAAPPAGLWACPALTPLLASPDLFFLGLPRAFLPVLCLWTLCVPRLGLKGYFSWEPWSGPQIKATLAFSHTRLPLCLCNTDISMVFRFCGY